MTPATDLGSVSFFVPGMPGTKGSAKAFVVKLKTPRIRPGKPPQTHAATVTNDAGDKAKVWAAVVALAAQKAMAGRPPFAGPVVVEIWFYLPRPKAHFGARGLKLSAPLYPVVQPDGDKMLRCTWDALTGVVLGDDAQIVQWPGGKRYADGIEEGGCRMGAHIDVRQLSPFPSSQLVL